MKKSLFLAMAISMGLMIGCGDDSSTSPSNSTNINGNSTESVAAFFPIGYNTADVVAWYATDIETFQDDEMLKKTVDAVYLFKDGTFLATESKLKVKDGKTKFSNGVATTGTWSGSDDFENGVFQISYNMEGQNITLPLQVENGSMTISPDGGRGMTFKLKKSSVPTPSNEVNTEVKSDSEDETPQNVEPGSIDVKCNVTTEGNSVIVRGSATGESFSESFVSTMTLDGDKIYLRDETSEGVALDTVPSYGYTLSDIATDSEAKCEELKHMDYSDFFD